MIVLVPAYQPDEKLVRMVDELIEKTDYGIVVVDDGSDKDRMKYFEQLEGKAIVLHHEVNRGKGAAIKTALAYIRDNYDAEDGIVTVDADGQHLVKDIIRVSDDWKANPDALVLGSRRFTGKVPVKSKVGNAITRFVFKLSTGVMVYDTQTGLRAFAVSKIPMMLDMKGDRYEYEINVLLYSTRVRMPIREVTIETVYIEENKSSHFHAFRDSWRIYKMIFLFVASSVASFLIDYGAFLLLRIGPIDRMFPDSAKAILFAEIGARAISSIFNFTVNKELVFEGKGKACIIRYFILVIAILALDYAILWVLHDKLGVPESVSKLISGVICYPVSFLMQRIYVFKEKKTIHG